MPNNYFQFKQFTVQQEHCALKVCTDACLFGAWVAKKIRNSKSAVQNILDIGTGTGLLSLMLAQQTDAIIDAVEIDESAAMQARQNFKTSPWKERLSVYNNSIQEFAETKNQPYELIISNPPFFENDLRGDNIRRNIALHSSELSLDELLSAIDTYLKDNGSFAVLLPYHRTAYFEKLAGLKYFLQEKILVKQTPKHNYFRSMLLFGSTKVETKESEIIIREEDQQYSSAFTELLKDYYLYL
ncbi:methyltransferase [Panacibacter ginsenosidivorans]|uniref:tRNA1(Val) (adenine(37)-N6)-methyltransferase n=1 Tax=Panacibacter ginsenosidivorans TaxID=1813871 RepID=A0A5B8VF31_9BACT|nr:methyltransferase [Panacibacter ginsenosidivorans]QEC69695.1 methyltransferase [Panacibacter ginsenosidivorans]